MHVYSYTNVVSENIKILCIVSINFADVSIFFKKKRENPGEDRYFRFLNISRTKNGTEVIDHSLESF